jgi:hypothetical protein
VDGKKVQVEEYLDVKIDPVLPEGLFAPAHFGKVYWMEGAAAAAGNNTCDQNLHHSTFPVRNLKLFRKLNDAVTSSDLT